MSRAAFDMNTFWLYAVLLHIVGSIVFSLTGLFPMGGLLCLTVLWGLFLYLSDRNIKNVCVILFGWLVSGILMFTMPISYGSSLLMNLLMLLLVWYVCRQRQTGLWEFSSLRWIPVRQWGIILLLSILLFLVASYVNALSMLLFQNMTSASLQGAGVYFLQSVLVFAVFPAVTEEILFRGYIFRGIADKNTAVLISAVMFALLHMNFNQMSYAFVMGLLFAILIRITDNLSVTIVLHLLFNCYNVFMAAGQKSAAVILLQKIQIGGYHLFAPSFLRESGGIHWQSLAIGTLIFLMMLAVVLFLLWVLQKMYQRDDGLSEGLPWHMDRNFLAGCAACLAIAISYEFLL